MKARNCFTTWAEPLLDTITRDLLDSGTLQRYIDELSVTGLTSNPTISSTRPITHSTAYDTAIRQQLTGGTAGETLFFALALEDLTRAATCSPTYDGRMVWTGGCRWKCRRSCYDTARTSPRP